MTNEILLNIASAIIIMTPIICCLLLCWGIHNVIVVRNKNKIIRNLTNRLGIKMGNVYYVPTDDYSIQIDNVYFSEYDKRYCTTIQMVYGGRIRTLTIPYLTIYIMFTNKNKPINLTGNLSVGYDDTVLAPKKFADNKKKIGKIIDLYEKCPIKSWRDLGDEDATKDDIRREQIKWMLNQTNK